MALTKEQQMQMGQSLVPGMQFDNSKKGGDAPAEYQGAAEQQGASSQANINQQTQANRPDQVNAFGASTQWTQGPDGRWTQTQSLGGGLGQASQNLMGQIGGQQPMNWGQFGNLGTGDQARDQAINAAYGQATSRLDPMFAQRETQLRSRLANQGLDPTTEPARAATGDFERARNDAYGSAMNSAIGQGTAAGSAVFSQNMASRQQAIAEALRARGMPMEELQKLQGLTGQQGFMGAGAADPTQYLTAMIAGKNFQQQQSAQDQGFLADLFKGLGEIIPG